MTKAWMTGLRILVVEGALFGSLLFADTQEVTRFERVTVAPSLSGNAGYSGRIHAEPGSPVTLTLQNVSLKFCLQQAYAVKEYQVTGPGWMRNARYDITATLPPGSRPEQVWQALRTLLAERLQVVIRREEKELPVFALTVMEGGPKLRAAEKHRPGALGFQPGSREDMGLRERGNTSGTLRLNNASVPEFCGHLSRSLSRAVIDATGIAGNFDFQLRYGNGDGPIATALQRQLGLKLVPRKAPVEMLLVESAVRKPVTP